MSVLTTAQVQDCAAKAAACLFGGQPPPTLASFSGIINADWNQIQSNVQALDNALDTTLNSAVSSGFGTDTIIQALAAQLTAPVSGWTAQQKYMLLCFVLLKRAGLL